MDQYGEPLDHKNEEAWSRFLAPVSVHSLSSFSFGEEGEGVYVRLWAL